MFAALVLAQTLIGSEITSAPLPARNPLMRAAAPAIAMARDEGGLVIAWTARDETAVNRLYVARLDAGAHVTGAVHEIPMSSAEHADADAPSIAKSATSPGFVLAWTETGSNTTAVFSRLDADLEPTSPQILTFANADASMWSAIARSGKSNWLTANGLIWRLNADGSLDGIPSGVTASDMVAVTDTPIAVGGKDNAVLTSCSCSGHFLGCPNECALYHFTFSIQVVWLYSASATRSFGFDSNAQPSIQSDGKDLLIAWFDGAQQYGGDVLVARLPPSDVYRFDQSGVREFVLGSFGSDVGPTRPDIATNGERYVVVWRTRTPNGDDDIAGASIDRDSKVTFLPIATSSADERDPSVIAVGDGRFLVAYEKISGNERRLAGRFVDFGNRRRAVR